jgi:N-acetyl-anhydromuramyl-L-alanine amidase AmpD
MQVDKTGWLEVQEEGFAPIVRVPSVRTAVLATAVPQGIVWHWTGGHSRNTIYAKALADEIRTFNRGTDRPASWHALIAKDGTIIQSVPFLLGSWHVGRPGRIGAKPEKTPEGTWDASAWDPSAKLVANINTVTIGIELVNAGRLERVGTKFYCWPFWLHPDTPDAGPDPRYEIEAERAVAVGGKWFDDYPTAQREAAKRLLQALALKFKWSRDVSGYGHVHFDPTRKEDPGPLWLDNYLPAVLDGVYGAG